jgi:hypothetical protein
MHSHHNTLGQRAAAAAALTLLISSCGGDKRLSRAEFLTQGNAICTAGQDKIDAAIAQEFPNRDERPDPAKFRTLVNETLIPNVRQQLDDIDDLKPPKDLQDEVDEVLSAVRAALDKTKEEVNKDTNAFLDSDVDLMAEANKKGTDMGLTVCGEP